MIVVTDVELVNVRDNHYIHSKILSTSKPWVSNPAKSSAPQLSRESVTGRVFRTPDGDELIIGMTEAVQKVLGLPFQVFEDQERMITDLSKEYSLLKAEVKDHRDKANQLALFRARVLKAGFWTRLKYLFTGKM